MKAVQEFSLKVILYVRSRDGQTILYLLPILEKHSATMAMCVRGERGSTSVNFTTRKHPGTPGHAK